MKSQEALCPSEIKKNLYKTKALVNKSNEININRPKRYFYESPWCGLMKVQMKVLKVNKKLNNKLLLFPFFFTLSRF